MEQVELFPIDILYKGITIEYDIAIYKESAVVNHRRKKMDEIKYRNKTIGYIIIENDVSDYEYTFSWVDYNQQGGHCFQTDSKKELTESVNKKLKKEIDRCFN